MDTKIIKQSFALMQPHADRIVRRAFQLLEERNQDVYSTFENSDMERQYSALTRSIAFIAYNIHNKERLVPYLQELGQRHEQYGVDSKSFALLTNNILTAMGECLGGTFSGEIKAEWERTFHFIVSRMVPEQADETLISEDQQATPPAETAQQGLTSEQQQAAVEQPDGKSPAGVEAQESMNSSEQNFSTVEGAAKVIHLTKEQLDSYSLPDEIERLINEQAQAAFQQAIHEAWIKALSEQEEKFKELQSQSPFRKEA